MVEKTASEDAPSNLVANDRYLLGQAIFDVLRRIDLGRGGELQLTGAFALLISEEPPSMLRFMMVSVMTESIRPASFRPVLSSASATRSMAGRCSVIWK